MALKNYLLIWVLLVKNRRNVILSMFFTIASIIYIYVVKTVDVKSIGPNDSKVGLSLINGKFHNLTGYNPDLYKITEIFGLLIFIIVGVYALIGLIQLIKRKSLFKVDREIIAVGILYVLMLSVYVLFEKLVINYRPILLDNELEASFPSSHTVLAICTCISSLIISKKYLGNRLYGLAEFFTILLLTVVFIGRTISGVHWLSDIVGGIIISCTLLMYFYTILRFKKE